MAKSISFFPRNLKLTRPKCVGKIFLMKKMEGWLNEGRELYYTRSTLINKANERRTSAKK